MRPVMTWRELPGQSINNPLGCETPAWVLNVVSVTEPDSDDMITISAVEGEVTVWKEMNWYGLWRSPDLADFDETLLVEELHRINGTETTG
ncbi:hypothetical protein NE236_42020 [Actinoallomurus purpureus]|uniref:hypothetical protein n=1 Tax=Actinoallomurus purpureus TaxID=478114 RepID=UPI002093AFEA|nr:hypothetical protein [Actinoallomurus purpureus]MCO6011549.1 hypothetical protein [Actinoallomurus purpureus]